jgi:hypothetical protein
VEARDVATDKQHILDEIKRLAAENDGDPVGLRTFVTDTGISQPEIYRHWVRWGDAVAEAGYERNELNQAYDEIALLRKLYDFITELGRFPVKNEFRMKARSVEFPSYNTFRRIGTKQQLAAKIIQHCRDLDGYDDVFRICSAIDATEDVEDDADIPPGTIKRGYVYMLLMKTGTKRYYKIGKTVHVERRKDQISIQLPEDVTEIHSIRTDDAYGIEEYWHKRFKHKKTKGEWFALSADDIKAFKQRKFM